MKYIYVVAKKMTRNGCKMSNSHSCGIYMHSEYITILIYQAWSWLQASLLTSSFDLFLTCIFFYYLSVFAAPWLWILFKQLVHFKTASATSIWGKRVSSLWRSGINFHHFISIQKYSLWVRCMWYVSYCSILLLPISLLKCTMGLITF